MGIDIYRYISRKRQFTDASRARLSRLFLETRGQPSSTPPFVRPSRSIFLQDPFQGVEAIRDGHLLFRGRWWEGRFVIKVLLEFHRRSYLEKRDRLSMIFLEFFGIGIRDECSVSVRVDGECEISTRKV